MDYTNFFKTFFKDFARGLNMINEIDWTKLVSTPVFQVIPALQSTFINLLSTSSLGNRNEKLYICDAGVDLLSGFPELQRFIREIGLFMGNPPHIEKLKTPTALADYSISNFEGEIKPFKDTARKTIKQNFIKEFRNSYVTEYTRLPPSGQNNPAIIQELLDAAAYITKLDNNGHITKDQRHEALTNWLRDSPYLIASELNLWAQFPISPHTYFGRIDLLMYDPISNVIYVPDYKPDMTASVTPAGKNFINAVPQVAAYALALQKLTGARIQSIIFSDSNAWSFDPLEVLAPIDSFMTQQVSGWQAPWADFSQYANQLNLFNLLK
jgi:hypothetical protein